MNSVPPNGVVKVTVIQHGGPPGIYIEDPLGQTLVQHSVQNLAERTSELITEETVAVHLIVQWISPLLIVAPHCCVWPLVQTRDLSSREFPEDKPMGVIALTHLPGYGVPVDLLTIDVVALVFLVGLLRQHSCGGETVSRKEERIVGFLGRQRKKCKC